MASVDTVAISQYSCPSHALYNGTAITVPFKGRIPRSPALQEIDEEVLKEAEAAKAMEAEAETLAQEASAATEKAQVLTAQVHGPNSRCSSSVSEDV